MSRKKDAPPPEPKEEKKPNPVIKLVYMEPTLTETGSKPAVKFLPITDEQIEEGKLPETLPEYCVYGGKVPKGIGRPGSIYQFERPPDKEGSIYQDTRRWIGFLNNDPRVVGWQARHDAFHAAIALQQQEKTGKNKNLIQSRLRPLKVAYSKMVGHQRAAFLAQIISVVTSRVTKADLKDDDTDNEDEGEC